MATLDFITSNPATDEWLRQDKERREQLLADARARLLTGQADDLETYRPSKLRTLEAGANTAESNARVGQATEKDRIDLSGVSLDRARTGAGSEAVEADVRRKTAPDRVELSGVNLSKAKTEAGSEDVEADVRRDTAPVRVQQASVGLRKATADATNSELQGFYKSIDLLNAGDVEGAKRVAAASGQELTDAHVNDAELRRTLGDAAKRAQQLYPNRPKDQQAFIQGRIDDLNAKRAAGQPIGEPTDEYSLPKGAPTPPEQTGAHNFELIPGKGYDPEGNLVDGVYRHDKRTGDKVFEPNISVQSRSGAGGSGKTSVFQQKQQAWLASHPDDNQGALDYASGRRQMGEPDIAKSALQMARAELNANTMMKFKPAGEQTQWVQQRASDIAQQLRSGFAKPQGEAPATAAPAAPLPGRPVPQPGPAAQRPDMMTPGDGGKPMTSVRPAGEGSRDQPFQAVTQENIEWFKENAPPGAVIVVNGTAYTK